MAGRVEVLKRMCVRRILAAADMTTGKANAKFVPRRAKGEAFLAALAERRDLSNSAYMFATLGDGWHIGVDSRTDNAQPVSMWPDALVYRRAATGVRKVEAAYRRVRVERRVRRHRSILLVAQ
jgi:hypothetical protein